MRREVKVALGTGVAVLGGLAALWLATLPERTAGPLVAEAYVWQRTWGAPVREAVLRAAPRLDAFVVLSAEVSFDGGKRELARVKLPYEDLASCGRPVGIALRVGPYPGPYERGDGVTRFLVELSEDLVREAREQGLDPAELQVDFDCATSKLPGYRVWIEEIRRALEPLPVTLTALPAWIGRRGFRDLVEASPGYVLQVHSLGRPSRPQDPIVLCDAGSARRWVERAARHGVPFRVALPTYGYRLGFDAGGKLIGLAAEQAEPRWPEGSVIREVRADADALAELVREWTEDRPALLRGLVWYRLPVDTDVLNWRWETLAAVLDGRTPHAELRAEARAAAPCLFELILINDGEIDAPLKNAVTVRWSGARLVAADAHRGLEWIDAGPGEAVLRDTSELGTSRIDPGEERLLGWIRLSEEVNVHVELTAERS